MTAPQDEVMVDDVMPGDVLMVTARPHNAYARLILALDGAAGRFSHCGVGLGNAQILSAYFDPEGRVPLDLGGLSKDHFSVFWKQEQLIHRLEVDPVDHEAAVGRLGRYRETPGSFSVPKIVAIAGALHALHPDTDIADTARARVVRRAIDLARAWEGDGDFYCAEFVTTVYGWCFQVADLEPPSSSRRPVIPRFAQVVDQLAMFLLTLGVTDDQRRTLYAFVRECRRSNPDFLGYDVLDLVGVFLGWVRDWLGFDDADLDDVDDSLETLLSEDLPPGLVTPRMVLSKHRGEGLPPLVRRRRGSVR